MLPVPPSSAKCAPTWSTVRRKSWLHPLSRDRVDNLSVHDLMRYEKMDETRSLILPKHLFNFQAQPFKMDSMRRQKAENKFPLILYDTSVPTGKFVSTPNKPFRNAEILGSRHKLKSQDNVQLLKPSVHCTILPWKSENLNKLLPLDKIKLLKKSNSGIGKKKHYPMNMSLLKSHFVMNKCNLPNPTIFQLLKLDKISPKIKQPFCKLIKLPYLKHSSDKHTDHNQNRRQMDNIISDSKEIPILGSKRSIYPNYHASTCKANSQEHTSQILTYPVVSEQYNEDQPTLNDISWAVDTTKDNIIKPMLPNSVNVCNSSHRDTNSPACGNEKNHSDFGAQFNFVDYGGPKAQVGFGTFPGFSDTQDFIEQLLQNDIGHFTKQFLSIHTSDLIDWTNEEDNKNVNEAHVPFVHSHSESSNRVQQHSQNVTQQADLQHDIRPMEKQTISSLNNVYNKASVSPRPLSTPTSPNNNDNTPRLIADPITAKTLAYPIINNKENIQSPMDRELFTKQGPNYFGIDVLKALSEIDNRLNVIDQVSVQLEQDHKRNQELLETIIQLNKGQNKSNSPSQLDNSTRIVQNPLQQSPRVSNDSSFKTSLLNAEKPLNDQSVPDMKIYSNDCTNLSSARQQTKSLKGNQRSRSTSGHYSEECEKARKERREVSVTRRCNEAKKFVNEILSESNLPIQSSPSLSSRPTTARTPSTTTPRGRGRVRIGGSSRVSTSRPTSKNCTAAFSPKPPTVVRSTTCGRGGIRARGAYNTLTDRRNQTDILQKPSIMGKPQSSSPGHPTFEDDLQTTILSDWSLESDVKRILYGDEEMRFHSPSKVQSICGDSNSYQECPVPQSPHSVPETDLLTEVGGVPSTSFIDWDEIDELIGAV